MSEFKSFIFEKQPAKDNSILCWIMAGLLVLGLVASYLDVMDKWLSIPFLVVPGIIYYYVRYKNFKFDEREELNGYFTDELTNHKRN